MSSIKTRGLLTIVRWVMEEFDQGQTKQNISLLQLYSSLLIVISLWFQKHMEFLPFSTTPSHTVPLRMRGNQNMQPQSATPIECFDNAKHFIKTKENPVTSEASFQSEIKH